MLGRPLATAASSESLRQNAELLRVESHAGHFGRRSLSQLPNSNQEVTNGDGDSETSWQIDAQHNVGHAEGVTGTPIPGKVLSPPKRPRLDEFFVVDLGEMVRSSGSRSTAGRQLAWTFITCMVGLRVCLQQLWRIGDEQARAAHAPGSMPASMQAEDESWETSKACMLQLNWRQRLSARP